MSGETLHSAALVTQVSIAVETVLPETQTIAMLGPATSCRRFFNRHTGREVSEWDVALATDHVAYHAVRQAETRLSELAPTLTDKLRSLRELDELATVTFVILQDLSDSPDTTGLAFEPSTIGTLAEFGAGVTIDQAVFDSDRVEADAFARRGVSRRDEPGDVGTR